MTDPDLVYNRNRSFLLVHPGPLLKSEFQSKIIEPIPYSMNVYVHNTDNLDWMLTVHHMVNTTIIDVDNCPSDVRELASYLIGSPSTYWLTNGTGRSYNYLNAKNRLFTLESLAATLMEKYIHEQE